MEHNFVENLNRFLSIDMFILLVFREYLPMYVEVSKKDFTVHK